MKKEEKIYEILSGLVDNELPPHQKVTAKQHLKNENKWQDEYDDLCRVKNILSSYSPQLETSPGFYSHLKSRIIEEQSQQTWWERLFDSGLFTKLSYSMVAASVLFIGFIGYQIYDQDSTASGDTQIAQTSPLNPELMSPSNSISPRQVLAAPYPPSSINRNEQLVDTAIISSQGILTIYKGNESIRIDLNSGKPFDKQDKSKLKRFKDVLSKLKYIQGIYFKDKGETQKSEQFFQEFVQSAPDSLLAREIITKGLVSSKPLSK